MASVSLRDIIGQISLTSMVNATVPDLPRRLPPPFYNTTREKVEGNSFRYNIFTPARQNATLTDYYAPSVKRDLRPIGSRDVMMFSSNMNMALNPMVLEALHNFENYEWQEKGKKYVALQMADYRRDFDHLEDSVALLILDQGIVYRKNSGEILPNSTGADITQDFIGNSSTNNGTIATITGVTGDWDSPSTNIWLQLEQMRIKAQQTTGYIPEIILYGRNVPTYISNNDSLQPYLARNPEYRDEWIKEGYIRPTHTLGGYQWYPIADAGFRGQTVTTYQLVAGNDDLIFLPAPDDSWWGWAEGSQLIPSTIDILGELDSAVGALTKVYGRYGYSKLNHDPVQMVAYAGTNMTPFIRIPDVRWGLTAK